MDLVIQSVISLFVSWILSSAVVYLTPSDYKNLPIVSGLQLIIISSTMGYFSKYQYNANNINPWAQWAGMTVAAYIVFRDQNEIILPDIFGTTQFVAEENKEETKEACCWDCGMEENLYYGPRLQYSYGSYGIKY